MNEFLKFVPFLAFMASISDLIKATKRNQLVWIERQHGLYAEYQGSEHRIETKQDLCTIYSLSIDGEKKVLTGKENEQFEGLCEYLTSTKF